MNFIRPTFFVQQFDGIEMLKRIEAAGRTCYKSEKKITPESAVDFVRKIIKSGHESVIEHESISARVICDRGVSHEIVRHRLASYSQESTRYCNYKGGVEFIIPSWFTEFPERDWSNYNPIMNDSDREIFSAMYVWIYTMWNAERIYKELLNQKWTPQMARSVLPNSLKTELVMTMNLREWRLFFRLRTAQAAHPQMREIAIPMLKEMQRLIPVVFDDIDTCV
jgi:thymidylate synthase (FAD)